MQACVLANTSNMIALLQNISAHHPTQPSITRLAHRISTSTDTSLFSLSTFWIGAVMGCVITVWCAAAKMWRRATNWPHTTTLLDSDSDAENQSVVAHVDHPARRRTAVKPTRRPSVTQHSTLLPEGSHVVPQADPATLISPNSTSHDGPLPRHVSVSGSDATVALNAPIPLPRSHAPSVAGVSPALLLASVPGSTPAVPSAFTKWMPHFLKTNVD